MVNRREVANVVTSTLTGLIDDNFNENEEEMSGSDVSGSNASESDVSNRIRVNLNGLNMDGIEVGELCDSNDFGRLDSAHESNSDGQNWPEFNLENDMSNPKLKACKDGYRAGCRRIVGLDRCFLKGYYGCYLVAVVGIDANNGIYPLAYAAGLLEAICMLFPNADLHANFKKAGFQTKELKDLLWKAAKASTTRYFEDAIDELKKTNQHAYDWLKEKNPTHWSMPHFSIRSHSDILVNNLSKFFNKREIYSDHDGNNKDQDYVAYCQEETDKWKGMLCPKIKKKLDVNIKDSLRFQVECGPGSQHVVDLVENSHSCRNWDLTGIPCMHAMAIILLKDEFPETYVQTWYTKQTQL
ncbi:uncharacterized protein [Gossypium hirsutum]|uniref:SWIM-type domain-containing protein n=1 Tax=Gossypium hirsutum TaxID=3635 RepID=A0A1U8HVH8_GOSHI|nr:uncharacterized protein LOC107890005 [Gossypium hirsutum]